MAEGAARHRGLSIGEEMALGGWAAWETPGRAARLAEQRAHPGARVCSGEV